MEKEMENNIKNEDIKNENENENENEDEEDLNNDDNQQNGLRILEAIDRFRQPIRSLSQSNKEKSIQYIQNLTQLASAII